MDFMYHHLHVDLKTNLRIQEEDTTLRQNEQYYRIHKIKSEPMEHNQTMYVSFTLVCVGINFWLPNKLGLWRGVTSQFERNADVPTQ